MSGYSHFNRKRAVSLKIALCLFVMLLLWSPLIVTGGIFDQKGRMAVLSDNACNDEWYDGSFFGIWTTSTQQGSCSGTITLGRSNHQGRFQGNVFTDTDEPLGLLQGSFYNGALFGSIDTGSGLSQRFFGTIQSHDTGFSAHLQSPQIGSFSCQGTYDASFLPPLTGPYAVGVTTLHLVDPSREEWFSADPLDVRELVAKIWYPTEEIDPQHRVDYMDETTFTWLKQQSPIPLVNIPTIAYTYVRPHCYEQAVISKDAAPFPLLLFSHGYDGVDAIYTSFIEDAVSNGYIVVSINHPYIAGITVFPDGRVIEIAPVPSQDVQEFFSRSLRTVIDDVYFVLDEITTINDIDDHLSGCFDLSKIGMYGHSFGGAATAVCCYEDERFKAGLTLDGVVYEELLKGNITKPLLMMLAEGRINDSNTLSLYDKISTDAYMVGVRGSTHYGYTDVGVLLSHLLPIVPQNILGFGTINAKQMVNITRIIEQVFFDVYLKGEDEQRLFDTFSLFDEILVQSK
ncbi:MAG: hypothetical protein V1769_06810 [Thermoplasmatota archaeon]